MKRSTLCLAMLGIALAATSCAVKKYDTTLYDRPAPGQTRVVEKGGKVWANGDHYEGRTVDGRPDGQGRLSLANGDRYVGGFAKGLMDGEGEYEGHDGSRYRGHFVADRRQGQGRLELADGSVFTGRFVDDEATEGRYTLASGEVLEGHFRHLRLHGQGSRRLVNGEIVQGRFVDGVPDGEIIVTPARVDAEDRFEAYRDGQRVFSAPGPRAIAAWRARPLCGIAGASGTGWLVAEGHCERGLLSGPGVLVREDSHALIRAEFRQGRAIEGEKTVYAKDGSIRRWKGPFAGTVIAGKGQAYRDGALVYSGQFAAEIRDGQGSEYAAGKLVYEGGFRLGRREGGGTCLFEGRYERCEYRQGARVDQLYLMRKELRRQQARAEQQRRQERQAARKAKQRREAARKAAIARFNQTCPMGYRIYDRAGNPAECTYRQNSGADMRQILSAVRSAGQQVMEQRAALYSSQTRGAGRSTTGPAAGGGGRRSAKRQTTYRFTCATSGVKASIPIEYSSQVCLAAQKNFARVMSCNIANEMAAARSRCEEDCGGPTCEEL